MSVVNRHQNCSPVQCYPWQGCWDLPKENYSSIANRVTKGHDGGGWWGASIESKVSQLRHRDCYILQDHLTTLWFLGLKFTNSLHSVNLMFHGAKLRWACGKWIFTYKKQEMWWLKYCMSFDMFFVGFIVDVMTNNRCLLGTLLACRRDPRRASIWRWRGRAML